MKEIISDYKKNYYCKFADEIKFFTLCSSLEEAISFAALARNADNKFPHQYRIKNEALGHNKIILLKNIDNICNCKSFHQLFNIIKSLVSHVNGIGPLVVYDTAIRIGAKLNLYPKYIYLHAGTKVGANNLGIRTEDDYVEKSQFSEELRNLEAYEIENILCIYKDRFKKRLCSHKDTPC